MHIFAILTVLGGITSVYTDLTWYEWDFGSFRNKILIDKKTVQDKFENTKKEIATSTIPSNNIESDYLVTQAKVSTTRSTSVVTHNITLKALKTFFTTVTQSTKPLLVVVGQKVVSNHTLKEIQAPKYILRNNESNICLWLQTDMMFELSYRGWNKHQRKIMKKAFINLKSNDTILEGSCFENGNEATLKIILKNTGVVQMEFTKDHTEWYISSIMLNIRTTKNPEFVNPIRSRIILTEDDLELFRTPLNHSYICSIQKHQRISNALTIKTTYLQIQPELMQPYGFNNAITCTDQNKKVEVLIIALTIACAFVLVLIGIYGSYLCRGERLHRSYSFIN